MGILVGFNQPVGGWERDGRFLYDFDSCFVFQLLSCLSFSSAGLQNPTTEPKPFRPTHRIHPHTPNVLRGEPHSPFLHIPCLTSTRSLLYLLRLPICGLCFYIFPSFSLPVSDFPFSTTSFEQFSNGLSFLAACQKCVRASAFVSPSLPYSPTVATKLQLCIPAYEHSVFVPYIRLLFPA